MVGGATLALVGVRDPMTAATTNGVLVESRSMSHGTQIVPPKFSDLKTYSTFSNLVRNDAKHSRKFVHFLAKCSSN